MPRRRINRPTTQSALLALVRGGLTIRAACAAVGIHPATAHRWTNASIGFALSLTNARGQAQEDLATNDELRQTCRIPVHDRCPLCTAEIDAVYTARTARKFRFWRCSTWPACPWASWRPRAPEDCPRCGGVRLWSHTRKTVVCTGCGARDRVREFRLVRAGEVVHPAA
jgi:ssDNA-binding Zn-finger/Zn-ribbon topoisomerase 1